MAELELTAGNENTTSGPTARGMMLALSFSRQQKCISSCWLVILTGTNPDSSTVYVEGISTTLVLCNNPIREKRWQEHLH